MSASDVVDLIGSIVGFLAVIVFAVLVGFLGRPLLKAAAVLDELTEAVRHLTEHTLPVIDEAAELVASSNTQLTKVDTITTAAAEVSQDVAALTALVSATVGQPLLKVAAFSAGVRRAFGADR
jgi:uncharacterized protein YoxC